MAYEYIRDQISHSWDIQATQVTKTAEDVIKVGHGICYAKSNLLAALLRGRDIPTGFCYQRLLLFDEATGQYCIHALNAVYITSLQKWVRLDARGDKPSIKAQFSLREEKLAFTVYIT